MRQSVTVESKKKKNKKKILKFCSKYNFDIGNRIAVDSAAFR